MENTAEAEKRTRVNQLADQYIGGLNNDPRVAWVVKFIEEFNGKIEKLNANWQNCRSLDEMATMALKKQVMVELRKTFVQCARDAAAKEIELEQQTQAT